MPGAGSTKGANWFQQQKNGDGTVMFGSSGSTQFPYLLDDPRVRYEYNDWNAVMASELAEWLTSMLKTENYLMARLIN